MSGPGKAGRRSPATGDSAVAKLFPGGSARPGSCHPGALWLWGQDRLFVPVEAQPSCGVWMPLERPWVHGVLTSGLPPPLGLGRLRWDGGDCRAHLPHPPPSCVRGAVCTCSGFPSDETAPSLPPHATGSSRPVLWGSPETPPQEALGIRDPRPWVQGKMRKAQAERPLYWLAKKFGQSAKKSVCFSVRWL